MVKIMFIEQEAKVNTDPRWMQVDAWNEKYMSGFPVNHHRKDGSIKRTKTRSRATVLSGHGAVVWLHNVMGCVALERVTPILHQNEPTSAIQSYVCINEGQQ